MSESIEKEVAGGGGGNPKINFIHLGILARIYQE